MGRLRGEAGYSLIEILIGLSIIALLVGVAGPRLFDIFDKGKRKVAEIQIDQIRAGLDLHRLDTGAYPSPEAGLAALIERPADDAGRWAGPYLDSDTALTDPWSNPYVYRAAGAGYELLSFGADGAPGGEGENADIAAR